MPLTRPVRTHQHVMLMLVRECVNSTIIVTTFVPECAYSGSLVTSSPNQLGVKCSTELEYEHPVTKVDTMMV